MQRDGVVNAIAHAGRVFNELSINTNSDVILTLRKAAGALPRHNTCLEGFPIVFNPILCKTGTIARFTLIANLSRGT